MGLRHEEGALPHLGCGRWGAEGKGPPSPACSPSPQHLARCFMWEASTDTALRNE